MMNQIRRCEGDAREDCGIADCDFAEERAYDVCGSAEVVY